MRLSFSSIQYLSRAWVFIFSSFFVVAAFQNCAPALFEKAPEDVFTSSSVGETGSCSAAYRPSDREGMSCLGGASGSGYRSRQVICSGSTWVTTPWGPVDYSGCSCSQGKLVNPTTGNCECPNGQVVIGGVCAPATCSAATKPSESEAKACPSGQGLATRTRAVTCSGTIWNAGVWSGYDFSRCGCPYGGQNVDTQTGFCSCPSGQTVQDGVCKATPTPTPTPTPSLTPTPSGTPGGTPTPTPPSVCSPSARPVDIENQTCPTGSLGQYTRTRAVTCENGAWKTGSWVPNYASCSCGVSGQSFDASKNPVCSCPASAPVISNNACVPTGGGSCSGTAPESSQTVSCPAGTSGSVTVTRTVTCNQTTRIWETGLFSEPDYSSCRCSYSGQNADIRGNCACPAGQFPMAATLSCGTCGAGQKYDATTKSCVPSSTVGCGAGEVEWGETRGCRASVAFSGTDQVLNVSSSNPIGSASFRCNSVANRWEFVSGSCQASCKVTSAMSMAWHSSNCVGLLSGGTYTHNQKVRITADATLSHSGANETNSWAEVTCYDGKGIVGDSVCKYGDSTGVKCPAGPIKWGATSLTDEGPCTGVVPEVESGLAISVGNATPGYQGQISGYCSNGKWEGVNSSIGCAKLSGLPQPCKGTYESPLISGACRFKYSAPVEGVPSGWTQQVSNYVDGYQGTIQLVCADGNWWQGPAVDCGPVSQTLRCPKMDDCFDLMTHTNQPIKACFKRDTMLAGGYAIVDSYNQPGCAAHVDCGSDGAWSFTKNGGKIDVSGTCKKPETFVLCSAGTASVESPAAPSGAKNTCVFQWPQGQNGNSVPVSGTNGGTATATCGGDGKWSYTYTCPAPQTVTCAGGSTTVQSPPNSSGQKNSCVMNWSQATAGNTSTVTGTNGGSGTATCLADGAWSFNYNCPAPGNTVTCSAGSTPVTSPKNNLGQTNTCVMSWGQATAGNTISVTGTNGGSGSATCLSDGSWSFSYSCAAPGNVTTCSGGSTPVTSPQNNLGQTNTCVMSWGQATAGNTVSVTGSNGGSGSATCQANGQWNFNYNCPAPGNAVTCSGGSQAVTSPQNNLGQTNTCVLSWGLATAGNTVPVTGTNGGSGSATCQSNGQWTYSYNCPAPGNVATCPGGATPVTSSPNNVGQTNTCDFSWAPDIAGKTVNVSGTNGGSATATCQTSGQWSVTSVNCPKPADKATCTIPAGVYTNCGGPGTVKYDGDSCTVSSPAEYAGKVFRCTSAGWQ